MVDKIDDRPIYVRTKIYACDVCMEQFTVPVNGFGIVDRGASGRWCVVMWICNDHGIRYEDVMTDEQLAEYISQRPGDWADLDM